MHSGRLTKEWVTDPGLIIVKTKTSKEKQKEHDSAVLQLVNAIRLKISNRLNYDHIKTTYPRVDIPLKYRKKRHDIAYETPTGNHILIEVKVRKKKQPKKSSKD